MRTKRERKSTVIPLMGRMLKYGSETAKGIQQWISY